MAGQSEELRDSALADPSPQESRPLVTLAALAAVIAGLYFLRDIFIPIALAVLLSFMLGPAVSMLRRWGIGRITSTMAVVIIAGMVIAGVTTVVAFQVMDLADNIDTYRSNLVAKARLLKGNPGEDGVVEKTSELIEDLSQELSDATTTPTQAPGTGQKGAPAPIPVEVHAPKPSPIELIGRVLWPLLNPLATAGVVIVFVIFILLYREDLRDRIIRLVSSGDLQRTTQAMSEAGSRVSRYLLMQLVVNTTYGVPIGLGLYFIGVPNPILWGLLATLLRFIPYVGPIIAAAFPIALSFAVDPGWTMPMLTVGLFLFLELVSNNIVEPWLYGASTGISSIAIIVAAVFWTWLWGPIGLLLSTPLTVCLAVLGQYVPQLRFLYVILGNAPVLQPPARFYQRLLAHDPDEATEIAEEFAKEHSLDALYDELIIPALQMAEQDRQRGALVEERLKEFTDSARGIIDEFADWTTEEDENEDEADTEREPTPSPAVIAARRSQPVLCVGARSQLDELAAAMLAQLLHRRGYPVARAAARTLESQELPTVSGSPVQLVAICSLHSSAILQIRRIVRRLRPKLGGARVLAAVLNGRTGADQGSEALANTTADLVAANLPGAISAIEGVKQETGTRSAEGDALQALQPKNSAAAEPEQALAQSLRRTILQPGEIDDAQAYLCHAYWQASDGGGDFVEAHRRKDGTILALLAALSSESVSSALISAALRRSLSTLFEEAPDPAQLLESLEQELAELAGAGEAIVAIALQYQPERRLLHICSAGNPEPILLRGETAQTIAVQGGPPLLKAGEAPEDAPRRSAVELVLEVGDRVLFYTEGAIEAAHPEQGFLEPAGLAAIAQEHRGFAGMTFLERLVAAIRSYGEEPEDDIVLLALEAREGVAQQNLPNAAD